jgi:hypothetical protein
MVDFSILFFHANQLNKAVNLSCQNIFMFVYEVLILVLKHASTRLYKIIVKAQRAIKEVQGWTMLLRRKAFFRPFCSDNLYSNLCRNSPSPPRQSHRSDPILNLILFKK